MGMVEKGERNRRRNFQHAERERGKTGGVILLGGGYDKVRNLEDPEK